MAEPSPSPKSKPIKIGGFTMSRRALLGMAVVLVIESGSWYIGLLQAALARVFVEGHN